MGSSPGILELTPLLGIMNSLDELIPNLFGSISDSLGLPVEDAPE